jgi:hypothetical protein
MESVAGFRPESIKKQTRCIRICCISNKKQEIQRLNSASDDCIGRTSAAPAPPLSNRSGRQGVRTDILVDRVSANYSAYRDDHIRIANHVPGLQTIAVHSCVATNTIRSHCFRTEIFTLINVRLPSGL